MRSQSKTVTPALLERRSARQMWQRLTRAYTGQDTGFSTTGGDFEAQAAHLLVHSRF